MKKNFSTSIIGLVTLVCSSLFVISCDEDGINGYVPIRPIGGYASTAEIAPENLVAHWAFNGSWVDSVQNRTAVATGLTFEDGVKGQAMKGNANGYLLVGSPGDIAQLQSYTISFWMKTPQAQSATGVFGLNNKEDFWGNVDIYLESFVQNGVPNPDTAFLKVHMNNDNAVWKGQFTDTKVPAAINQWVHIAVSYNGETSVYNIFANGRAVGVNTAGNPANTIGPKLNGNDPASTDELYGPLKFVNATDLVFGTFQFQTNPSLTNSAGAQSWAGNFEGLLDEFRIYNTALSASDINALYKLEKLGR